MNGFVKKFTRFSEKHGMKSVAVVSKAKIAQVFTCICYFLLISMLLKYRSFESNIRKYNINNNSNNNNNILTALPLLLMERVEKIASCKNISEYMSGSYTENICEHLFIASSLMRMMMHSIKSIVMQKV